MHAQFPLQFILRILALLQSLISTLALLNTFAAAIPLCSYNRLTTGALLAEFMGFEQQLQPVWLARDSERIWRGSYKNKAWKHLV